MSNSFGNNGSMYTAFINNGTVNPRDLLINSDPGSHTSGTDYVDLSYRLQEAIQTNDLPVFLKLIGEGATPMMLLPNRHLALDFAIERDCEGMVCFFHWFVDDIAKVGLRALLTATLMRRTEMLGVILDIGMREKLAEDEAMKMLVFGWVCKHGTPEILDILDEHGPEFNWKACWGWCWVLSNQTSSIVNGSKIIQLRNEYMDREWHENPFGAPASHNTTDGPPLHKLLERFFYEHPEFVIHHYWEYEFCLPRYIDLPNANFDFHMF
ncbi:uncharacterized protein BDV14DRAFT_205000 [Aspergillus stella-maris]|uniref:uncharacterized protein n=1 Tax=Aspergillus stella-maris TaxID=1810926 RepID=UPI003CCD90E0